MMRVNIRELIRFYDEDRAAKEHSNAIKTVAGEELNIAALIHYLQSKGARVDLLDEACTTGTRRGSWLDAWVRVSQPPDQFYYQVEVKSWSFHGVGGGPPLLVDCSTATAMQHRIASWGRYWDATSRTFRHKQVHKVLTRMRCPAPSAPVRALLCLWDPVHPQGLANPFFEVKPSVGDFSSVFVFSTSSYMRHLLCSVTHVDLPLYMTKTRLNYLASLFAETGTGAAQQAGAPDGAPSLASLGTASRG
jgi:hypothetical protein